MNNSVDQLKDLIKNYRKILIPSLLIVASFFIVILVILPQITSILDKMREITGQNDLIAVLKNSQKTVVDTPDAQVDADFDTTTRALPVQKDVSFVFDALTTAAAETGTSLDSFAITVGGIFGKAAETSVLTGNPSMKVTAHVSGDVDSLVEFTKILNETLPISEISKIEIINGEALLEIDFYYKPVDSSKIASQDTVTPLSQADKNILNRLKDWEN